MYDTRAMLASKYYPVISFTAGSVVVRMTIDGDDVWGYLIPDRDEMLNSLVSRNSYIGQCNYIDCSFKSKAIPKWDIEHKKQDSFARGLQ